MALIGIKEVLKQIKWDLIGKDSQRGISLTYAWLCNQWGHIALGFIPAIFMGVFGYMNWFGLHNIIIAGLLISVVATVFEAYNFLVPLLSKKKHMTFSPAWINVGFDTFTDLIFFYIGGLSAIQVLKVVYDVPVSIGFTYALCACVLYVFVIFSFWYKTKMYLQSAGFPFQFRLSQWMNSITESNKNEIIEIVKQKKVKQILIFGGEATGKTGLAVGIATEFSISRLPVVYSTACKMSEMFLRSDSDLKNRFQSLWTWRQAQCLVIDDINSGNPVPDIITPKFLRPLFFNDLYVENNLQSIRSQTVIWVVGNAVNKQSWVDFILEIGIKPIDIVCIEL